MIVPASGMSAEPVAWRVYVYAGGYINARSLADARQLALGPKDIEPLYTADSLTQELAAKDKEIEGLRAKRNEYRRAASEATERLFAAEAQLTALRSLVTEAAAEIARLAEHFGSFADARSTEATTETWAALHCARDLSRRLNEAVKP